MTTARHNRWIAARCALGLVFGLPAACASGPLPSTSLSSAPAETDAEQQALRVCEGGPTVYGIDISNNNGSDFDLAASKANGVRFVYLKASQGDYFTDETYAGYQKTADKLGLIHGAYHFFDPQSDPNAAADLFLKVIGSAPPGDLPPALDWEITSGIGWDEAFARAQIFLDRVEAATGRTPIIYTYPDFFGQTVPPRFAKYPLWISNPGASCPQMPDGPWSKWTLFQFDTNGLDRDDFEGDLAALQGFDGNGSSSTGTSPQPAPVTQVCKNVAAGSEPVLSGCNAAAIDAVAPASAKAFLDRAYAWIDQGVMYSQEATHDDYRTDCSGYVSYVWQLQPAGLGCPWTEDFAGGYDDNHESVRISWNDLTPGDALVDPADHIMLWGGWLDSAHTQICTMEEYYPGEPASFMSHSIYEDWPVEIQTGFLPVRKAGYVPSTTTCSTLAAPLDQIENNGGLSAMSWSDGHVEVFAHAHSGHAVHAWTDGASDDWHGSEELSGDAACGLASVMSYAGEEHAELFAPEAPAPHKAASTQSAYYLKGWHGFDDFGGAGVTQLATLRWSDEASGGANDGRSEVFGLASNGRIFHRYYDPATKGWSGWASLGGRFATGVSAILDKDGHGLLFGTDAKGQAWVNESRKSTGDGWLGWRPLGGALSSRPVAVREANGTLRLFGRGLDGRLYAARSEEQGYSPFEPIGAPAGGEALIAGEPSAALDDGNVEVFVRDERGTVSVTTLDPKTHRFGPLEERSGEKLASDPLAWKRPDGRVELFGVTTQGHLAASYHSRAGWTQWKRLATGVDSCPQAQLAPPTPAAPGSCTDTADCASQGSGMVCVMPALYCSGAMTGTNNYCSLDPQATLDQPCTQDSDCDPGTGTMVCGACIGSCGATHCCNYAQ